MNVTSSPVRFESWLISHCSPKLVYNHSEFWWVNYFEHYVQLQSIHESSSILINYWGGLEFYCRSSCQLLLLKVCIFSCLYFNKFWDCTPKRSTNPSFHIQWSYIWLELEIARYKKISIKSHFMCEVWNNANPPQKSQESHMVFKIMKKLVLNYVSFELSEVFRSASSHKMRPHCTSKFSTPPTYRYI
jgi:hypothetical protein